ncbi:uncharacterized protein FOMMEDRAFT_170749 [Fomitiporia mediterranea MF3/22]|uniref:uncharacterized protein n=1 Tax=Fomitiporia mediterranea (strain MF3/22) TaxID=694068 RepID=UPI0004408DC3|nr:uncharacterized protein FOMMEDRAFT_170749 [Fomitiporia mediterranea MF3/22]EJC98956.1 hypothetical protein FOMMEDRAFT_170749 [Fomitiporia mediterranea MF3/22]
MPGRRSDFQISPLSFDVQLCERFRGVAIRFLPLHKYLVGSSHDMILAAAHLFRVRAPTLPRDSGPHPDMPGTPRSCGYRMDAVPLSKPVCDARAEREGRRLGRGGEERTVSLIRDRNLEKAHESTLLSFRKRIPSGRKLWSHEHRKLREDGGNIRREDPSEAKNLLSDLSWDGGINQHRSQDTEKPTFNLDKLHMPNGRLPVEAKA